LSHFFCAAFVAVALTGCNDEEDYPEPINGLTQEPLLPITLATVPSDDFLPFWVAENEGIFEELGS